MPSPHARLCSVCRNEGQNCEGEELLPHTRLSGAWSPPKWTGINRLKMKQSLPGSLTDALVFPAPTGQFDWHTRQSLLYVCSETAFMSYWFQCLCPNPLASDNPQVMLVFPFKTTILHCFLILKSISHIVWKHYSVQFLLKTAHIVIRLSNIFKYFPNHQKYNSVSRWWNYVYVCDNSAQPGKDSCNMDTNMNFQADKCKK